MLIQNYLEWKNCIEVKCGIPLTEAYVQKRIEELTNESNSHTKEFVRLYGKPYKEQILLWFTKALQN